MFDQNLMDRQIELEMNMREEGIAAFRSRVVNAREKGVETTTSGASTLLRHILSPTPTKRDEGFRPFDAVIKEFVARTFDGRAGVKAKAALLIKEFELDYKVIALITVKTILDSISQREDYTKTCKKIGSEIENEARFRSFKAEYPGLFYVLGRDNTEAGQKYKTRLVKGYANKAGHHWDNWALTDRIMLGAKMVELLIESTGIIEIIHEHKVKGRKRSTSIYIQATPETAEWITKKHSYDELLCPNLMPTIVPPKKWTNPFNGGYWSEHIHKPTLIKTMNRNYLSELANQEMPQVYNSLNALQETSWQINKEVYEVMEHLWTHAEDCPVLPTSTPAPAPVKPVDIDTNEEARKVWRQETSRVHQANRAKMSRAFQIKKIMVIAKRFLKEEKIYFPYCLDFRGRAYAIPMLLNPQGSKHAKALLKFGEGKPVGHEGARWLAVHGANSFGKDKLAMLDRVAWVEENKEFIRSIGEDPLTNREWMEADDPWGFLAFCFEWKGVLEEGLEYISHLPVALDGSCNGLQHYSAALRDEVGGKAVNLVPNELPSDIYQTVLDEILPTIQKDAAEGLVEAKEWIDSGLLSRKITKRPTMTMVYGATQYGMRTQVHQTLKEIFPDIRDIPFSSDGWPASFYMGNLIFESLSKVVSKASEAMVWLQEAARIAASEELPLYWETPVGFPVQQAYKREKMTRINTMTSGDIRIRVRVAEETDKLNKKRQANGVAPNFVHSLDAAHMMLTINKCTEQGINHFAMVHDSYGTHACDALGLTTLLREAFVEIHEENILEKLRDHLKEQLTEENFEKLTEIPQLGNLDLSLVHDSMYFFA